MAREQVPPPERTTAGAGVGAFFDMDYTILSGSSGLIYLRWLRRSRKLSLLRWARITGWVGQYIAGITDFPHMMAQLTAQAAGEDEGEAWKMTGEWFTSTLRAYISGTARQQVAWHKTQGHRIAIVSAATPYVVYHVGRDLGLTDEDCLCTHLELVAGRFTGNIVEPACYGAGKVALAGRYAEKHGLDLGQSYFYSDSDHDLPLLTAVGHPVAVNPNQRLARVSADRGWPVLRFY